jgi:hypothetical protein
MLIVGAVEVEDGGLGPGRIRLSQVPDYSIASLHAFLAVNLGSGATWFQASDPTFTDNFSPRRWIAADCPFDSACHFADIDQRPP